jgi:23S rRNA (uracil1939-C5)-methyltransferase
MHYDEGLFFISSTLPYPTNFLTTMSSQEYHIEKLVHGGSGLSHTEDGQIVLLEGAAPGETVQAKIHSTTRNLLQGSVTRVISASVHRIQAPCPHYRKCGGCDFQHMDYSCQLQGKYDIVKDLLLRSSHPDLRLASTVLTTPIASPQEMNYRQRIRLQVDEQQIVGFHKRRSNNCIAVKNCLLAAPAINNCLEILHQQRSFDKLLAQTDALEILLNPDTSSISIIIHFKRKPRPADKQHAKNLAQSLPEVEDIFFMGEGFAVTGHSKLSFTLPPIPLHTEKSLCLSWETGGFCQVNIEQNRTLIQTVLNFCQISRENTILDLFCGMGNFSIPLAEKAETVLGIEGQASAIRSARINSAKANQNNTEFIKRPIHQACRELVQNNRAFDCIVLDPPRQGVPGLAGELGSLCRKRMIYISCDPATLCRDLAELLKQGFVLQKLQLIDMFPQTHHIETIALLEKL